MPDNPTLRVPEVGEGKRGEQGHIGYLLRQASSTVRHAIERELSGLDVTHPQFLVMTMIRAYPGSSSADLARLTMLTPQTICVIVANLERTGRVVREVSAAHGRIQIASLTDSGAVLLDQCKQHVRRVEIKVEATLPPDLEPELRRWLVTLAATELSSPTSAQ